MRPEPAGGSKAQSYLFASTLKFLVIMLLVVIFLFNAERTSRGHTDRFWAIG